MRRKKDPLPAFNPAVAAFGFALLATVFAILFTPEKDVELSELSTPELRKKLKSFVAMEDYDNAITVRDIINSRRKKNLP